MRDGTRTVLAMQNDYDGPVEDFAIVVPVPVVLHDGDVKTIPREVFARVNQMSSPRLVEYWEQDPCPAFELVGDLVDPEGMRLDARDFARAAPPPVVVEATFDVDEYQVVILSATESTALARYLRGEHYQIPAGAAPLLRPYVEAGSKFFVAKVDPHKVRFEHGHAVLSPLRFFYDSDDFTLPIRLGLANSAGTQDLIVNIFAEDRYEVANYPNAFIPTNLDVVDGVRTRFGELYGALFDRTVQENPGAVITEYAWPALGCDPCPGPRLDGGDLHRLRDGTVSRGVVPADANAFQARYTIRHPWTGPVSCAEPIHVWGGRAGQRASIAVATDVASAPRGRVELQDLVAEDVPEIAITRGVPLSPPLPPSTRRVRAQGCGCETADAPAPPWLVAVAFGLRRRRRPKQSSGRSGAPGVWGGETQARTHPDASFSPPLSRAGRRAGLHVDRDP